MKSSKPKISVVMSVYSEPEEWLRESIDSILAQTYQSFEFIIINDNPLRVFNNDILDEYKLKDHRIIIINNEHNLGLTKSLNIGLKLAKGKYIARMDADDISLPERFQQQYIFMEEHSEVIACGCFIDIFGIINRKDCTLPVDFQEFKNVMLLKNPLPHPTAFIRNEIVKHNLIKYDESLRFSQDYDLWKELSKYGELTNLPQILVKYRVQGNQISISNRDEQAKCARGVRNDLLNTELVKAGLSLDFSTYPLLFKKVSEKVYSSDKKSYLLLLIFLSYPKYGFKNIIKSIFRIKFSVLYCYFKLIIKRILFPQKYPSLL